MTKTTEKKACGCGCKTPSTTGACRCNPCTCKTCAC
jgi:hypothetical protein